jgi:hypothetical protein
MRTPRSRTDKVALAAVFAALYFVLRSLPVFEMIGVSGRFTAGDFLLTTIALVVGLWGGILSVLVGTFLAYPISATPFLGLDFLPGVMNILIVGLILQNRRGTAQAIYIMSLLLFLVSPYSLFFGYAYVPYTWLHIVALILLLSPVVPRVPEWVVGSGSRQIAAVAVLAFVGTMAQHITGALLFEFVLGMVQGESPSILRNVWQLVFWVYPIERLLITAISTAISLGLVRAMKRLGR